MEQGFAADAVRARRLLCSIRGNPSLAGWNCPLSDAALQSLLKRDRAIVAACLFALILLAWVYTAWLAADMTMGGMDMTGYRMVPAGIGWIMPAAAPWQGIEFALVFLMWAVMMVGMMTPSVAPLILLYARVGRQAAAQQQPFAASAYLASGYLLAWIAFSLAATIAQWLVDRAGWFTPEMAGASKTVGGLTLVAAGLYQWTSLKDACLRQCQAPLQFIQRHGGFRGDALGSFKLGALHGLYCIGCCWMLMALLFVGGIMNVLWIALIMTFVLIEKVISAPRMISRLSGAALMIGGAWIAFAPSP